MCDLLSMQFGPPEVCTTLECQQKHQLVNVSTYLRLVCKIVTDDQIHLPNFSQNVQHLQCTQLWPIFGRAFTIKAWEDHPNSQLC